MTGTANPPEIEQAQTATLRRIGRNLVNVQRIEVMMKFLLQVSFSGPLQGIETQLKKHMDKVSRKTLGALIPELAESVFPPGEAMSSERLWIRTSIDFPAGGHLYAARAIPIPIAHRHCRTEKLSRVP